MMDAFGALRQVLIDGENSGDAGELEMDAIKSKAPPGKTGLLMRRIRKHARAESHLIGIWQYSCCLRLGS
jgi:hypothetical protein